ncbi:MAG: glycosyltransferase family 4 protein [Candidatus Buchananbacteria bacterium]|nr:glycosyltransferase family 4 protein [Candidatus Buchananbacteria bacterium]
MKVLIISIDKGLLGRGQLGDALERHKKYGDFCDKLDIIVMSKKGFDKYKISDKVTAYPTNSSVKLKYIHDAYKIGKNLFKENNYDLIITQTPFVDGLVGWRLKSKFKSKLLVHFHGDFWDNIKWLQESGLNYFLLPLSKLVVKHADAVRVMSSGQKEKIIKVGVSEKKVRVISTPIDLSKYLRISNEVNHRNILHIGRDDEVKDYNTLVKSFKLVKDKISDVNFIQAGADTDREIKKAMVKNNFSAIDIRGKIKHNELTDLYSQIDFLVLSSTSESFGKVLVESNASGKPVVSTATTGAKEIIEDGKNGFLVPIGDAEKLAEKIIWLLQNQEEAKKMGAYGRELAKERYSDNTNKIINFWTDIINNNL